MNDMNERFFESAETIVRESAAENARREMPLYRRRKGKEFHASGGFFIFTSNDTCCGYV